ncbi:hypothetical protein [Halomarina ordinaria]|uniref:Uncharacterized protein n=1 Tax=Halomarina ordinaria TaxID=3033939 RepID=A0ABD5UIH4_9EURY|nr:hypothetical protein [Halomarina sp. PSRA2]
MPGEDPTPVERDIVLDYGTARKTMRALNGSNGLLDALDAVTPMYD